jgi:hypothetical protein
MSRSQTTHYIGATPDKPCGEKVNGYYPVPDDLFTAPYPNPAEKACDDWLAAQQRQQPQPPQPLTSAEKALQALAPVEPSPLGN